MIKYYTEIDGLHIMGWVRVAEDVSSAWEQNGIRNPPKTGGVLDISIRPLFLGKLLQLLFRWD